MNLHPYLCVGGTEVALAQRTLSYLARGLGGANLPISVATVPAEPEAPYQARFPAYCPDLDDGDEFVSPEDDDAPWYDDAIAASAGFLGLLLTRLELTGTPVRGVSARAMGGANVGSVYLRHRILMAEGFMFAATAAGMAFGESWLQEALAGPSCEACGGDEAEVLPACGGEEAFRMLREVGLVDGPVFSQLDKPRCTAQRVSFQLVAGDPRLYWPAEVIIDGVETAGPAVGGVVEAPAWCRDAAVRIEVEALADAENVLVVATPMATDAEDETCPDSVGMPCSLFSIPRLDRGHRLIIDGGAEDVLLWDETSKNYRSGYGLLRFTDFAWPVVPPCTRMCVQVLINPSPTGPGDVGEPPPISVTVTSRVRSL